MSYQIEAIKFGINTYFRDCEIEKYEPSFTKSEAFDEVITNHSLQEIRDYYCVKNNKQPTYQDIAKYVHDICYLF
jgi:hypothetical protein